MFETVNLTLAIQISSNKVKGSGFLVNHENYSYLITAKHVLLSDKNKLIDDEISILNHCIDGSKTRHDLELNTLEANGELKYHLSADICVIRLFKFIEDEVFHIQGVHATLESESPAIGTTFDDMMDFENIGVGTDVYIVGYPSSIGIKDIPQIDYNEPLVRKGIVSGLNSKNEKFIIDTPVYPGNSGGPVVGFINLEGVKYDKIAGIISQFIPYEDKWYNPSNKVTNSYISNSGYSVIEPMDFVKELIISFN